MADKTRNTEPVWVILQDTLEVLSVPWDTKIRGKDSGKWKYWCVGDLRDHPQGADKFFQNIQILYPSGSWGTFAITSEPQEMTVNLRVKVRVDGSLTEKDVEGAFRDRIPEQLTGAMQVTDVQVSLKKKPKGRPAMGLIEEFWGKDHPYPKAPKKSIKKTP